MSEQIGFFGAGATVDEASPPPITIPDPEPPASEYREPDPPAPEPEFEEDGSIEEGPVARVPDEIDRRLYGDDLFGDPATPETDEGNSGPVFREFLFPPFSVFDARAGYWQERKRAWVGLGIRSEVGREAGLTGFHKGTVVSLDEKDTSIFDPVLCELLVRWFSSEGDLVLDPFAGGSVRGIVSGCVGRYYYGVDLRTEQVEANREQATRIRPTFAPEWVVGDALDVLGDAPAADYLLTCPPYGDLERYSDDPKDLSTMEWPEFLDAYRAVAALAFEGLRPDRFAALVVGDFRDAAGLYRNFVGETIRAFLDAGFGYYNEAILSGAIATASMRVSRQFRGGRKFAKTHQNVLVFIKGDWKKAVARLRNAEDV